MQTSLPLDARAVRAAYQDLVGRPPFLEESLRWPGRPRAELVDALLAAPEAWRQWLDEELWYFLLVNNFAPRSETIGAIPEAIATGKLDVRAAVHRIALSPNFEARNPGADTFVTVVMEQLAGLEVERNARELALGKKAYDGGAVTFLGAPARTQADVVTNAIQSEAFARHFLARQYARILRVPPEPKALTAWAVEFQREPARFRDLCRAWFLSEAWDERLARRAPLSNRAFVRALFVDVTGKLPSEAEAETMREALDALADPAPLRAVLARLVIESKRATLPGREQVSDAETWIRDQFARFLGRVPKPEELAEFLASWRDPACQPRTIVLALVTAPEYQQG
ncbi:MAG: hypothetical protein NTY35_11605 [Planctomycetota bacterium]|nr:hypothetical protein [Planctomycetota bacterium]